MCSTPLSIYDTLKSNKQQNNYRFCYFVKKRLNQGLCNWYLWKCNINISRAISVETITNLSCISDKVKNEDDNTSAVNWLSLYQGEIKLISIKDCNPYLKWQIEGLIINEINLMKKTHKFALSFSLLLTSGFNVMLINFHSYEGI